MNISSTASPAAPTFLVAMAIVLIGTVLLDVTRVLLLLIPLSFLFAAYGTGLLLERAADRWMPRIPVHLTMLRLTLRLGTGISLLGVAATFLGLIGLFRFAWIFVGGGGAWGLFTLCRTMSWERPRITLGTWGSGTAIGLVWLVAWLWGTVPPTFYDELVYHLPIPQDALRTGTLPASPWSYFTMMPYLSDLLLAWGLALGGDLGARAMHLTFWFGIWIAAWGLLEALFPAAKTQGLGLALAGAFTSSATFYFLGTLPFAECSLTFAVLASTALILSAPPSARWLPLGLIWGFVMSVKLSGPSWVLAMAIAALVVGWSVRSVLAAGAVAAGCMLPWWGRAWVLTGNPFYPLGYKWLGGRYWDDASETLLQQDLPHLAPSYMTWLRLPYDMVAHSEQFGSASDVGIPAVIGICAALSFPLWVRFLDNDEAARRASYAVSLFTGIAGICWVLTSTTSRFFAPALVLGLVLIVALVMQLPQAGRTVATLCLVLLGAVGTHRFITQHSQVFSSQQVALGRESPSRYLSRTIDHFESARYVRDQIPPDARLLFIGESRPFYFERSSLAPYPFHEHPLTTWLKETTSTDQVMERLRQEGITHIVLNTREFKRLHDTYHVLDFTGVDGPALDQRLKRLPGSMKMLFAKNNVYVFEVPDSPRPPQSSS